MMNNFGKILVLGQTALSLLFMTWAVMIYLQFNDYGWKEPFKVWETKDTGYRLPSQLDKRTAILYELYRQNERAIPGIKPALETLNNTMEFFPKNHQVYVKELEQVRSAEAKIDPKQLVWKDGQLVLEKPGRPLGKPEMKASVGGIEKSTRATKAELDAIVADINVIVPEIADLTKKSDAITIELYGSKDDKNKSVDIGLYEVLDNETTLQDKIRQERDYITPRYVDAQRRVESFRDRFARMNKTLEQANLKK